MRPTATRDITDRDELAEFFADRPDVHIYGLGDLEEPFWTPSRWIRRGDAVVGFVRLADAATPMVYAVSTRDPEGTLDLLVDQLDQLPVGTLITGPVGLAARVGTVRERIDMGPHVKMVLGERGDVGPAAAVPLVPLESDDLAAIEALLATEPGAAFFSASMLADHTFVGARAANGDGALVAMAGTHVVSERYGVAAIGAVFTHPDHRGNGLGSAVTQAAVGRLRRRLGDQLGDQPGGGRGDPRGVDLGAQAAVIGLNVAAANEAARRAYARIGFRECWTYEEVELQ